MAGQDDKSPTCVSPADSSANNKPEPQKMKKYGDRGVFRLTPEEQELAYELKANMMRKLDEQNEKLETEILLNEKLKGVKRAAKTTDKPKKFDNMSLSNAIKLMRMYERKFMEADDKIKKLEEDLKQKSDLARRYRDMCARNGVQQKSRPHSRGPTEDDPKGEIAKVTEDGLDDDEAVFKRHVARLAETKSMKLTAPIRVQDVIRKNEVLLEENTSLIREVQRLKEENERLIFKAKHATTDKDELLRHLGTSEENRRDLLKRLEKEQKQTKHLSKSLTRQATEWMQLKKDMQYQEDRSRLINSFTIRVRSKKNHGFKKENTQMVVPVSVLGAEERTWAHPAKKNVYLPRKMIAVEEYSAANRYQ